MENKEENKKHEHENKDEKKIEKTMEKIEEKKKNEKKDRAFVRGKDLAMSAKHAAAVCDFIRGKSIEDAVNLLEQVIRKEKAVPMKGEYAHKKGCQGKYPVNVSKIFIRLLKNLNANANVNGLNEPVISKAMANLASRPFKRFGSGRFKRAHVYLEVRERQEKKINKQEHKEKKDGRI